MNPRLCTLSHGGGRGAYGGAEHADELVPAHKAGFGGVEHGEALGETLKREMGGT
jgi:hypothetical protein